MSPVEVPTKTTPKTTTPNPAPEPEIDPDRRLNPERLCPAQKERVVRGI